MIVVRSTKNNSYIVPILQNRKDIMISLLLFFVAFIIRFLLISKGPFHSDTLELAINAEKTLNTFSLHYLHATGYPLIVITASIFIFLIRFLGINDPVFCVNIMSVVFGSLGIGIFYLFSRKILDILGASISSLILALLPLHISVSTFGMTHPLSIFFHLIGFYFLFLYLEKYKLNRLIISAIFFGFGAAARLTDSLIIIAVIFLYLFWSFKNSMISKKDIIYRLASFLILYSVVTLLFYLPMFLEGGLSHFKDTMSAYYFYHSLSCLYGSLKYIIEILSLPGVIISFAGMGYFFLERNRSLFYFLLIWFFSLFSYYGTCNAMSYRYLLLPLLPALIMQGYFISKLFKFKRLVGILICFLLFISVVKNFIEFYPIIQFRNKNSLQEDFARFVQRNTEPNAYIIAMDEGCFIEYYAKRKILYKATGLNEDDFDEFFKRVDLLLDKDIPIYIISTGIYGYDPKKFFITMLLNNYILTYIGEHPNEAWHKKSIKQSLFLEKLYKIQKRG
ncbi:MAG: glycosyltransferase family 39 protein [Parcubacteria group bacterium]|nr:glycosyltransferase family 39 protein [Parcubacteria group bacterium]